MFKIWHDWYVFTYDGTHKSPKLPDVSATGCLHQWKLFKLHKYTYKTKVKSVGWIHIWYSYWFLVQAIWKYPWCKVSESLLHIHRDPSSDCPSWAAWDAWMISYVHCSSTCAGTINWALLYSCTCGSLLNAPYISLYNTYLTIWQVYTGPTIMESYWINQDKLIVSTLFYWCIRHLHCTHVAYLLK